MSPVGGRYVYTYNGVEPMDEIRDEVERIRAAGFVPTRIVIGRNVFDAMPPEWQDGPADEPLFGLIVDHLAWCPNQSFEIYEEPG